ncbi:MAG: hypothetical protein IPM56_16070 [Ignavibacteriales bacterium]|nr:MAG: hypothetical protein IPM56_16070 [Ignavibacteriales bacterium]
MQIPRTLNEAIYRTLHRSKKNIKEIADEIGKKEVTLYRWASPDQNSSHSNLPIKHLLALLNSSNNDAILDYFEWKRGRVAVKIPRAAISRLEETELVEHYQESTLNAVKSLRTFLNNPTAETFKAVDDALRSVMSESASIDRYVTKKATRQIEMEM